MRARDAFDVLTSRAGRAPAAFADTGRVDQVEVVDLAEGETLLLWDCTPREASRLTRALRADLASLDADTFRERWSAVQDPDDLPG
jgi:hypothetical protein